MAESSQPAAISSARSISRREVFTWVVSILAAHYFLMFRGAAGTPFLDALTQSLVSKSVFHYLGWYAVFQLLADSEASRSATKVDLAVGLAVLPVPFLSGEGFVWIAMTVVGLYLWATSRGDRNIRAAATVVLALSLNGLWGRLLFDLLAPPLLQADTALVGALLAVTRSGYAWNGTIISSDVHSIIVLSGCSSFHNMSLGLLCWVALTKLARPQWIKGDAWVALAVCAVVLLLNTLRIYLMAFGPAFYAYLHMGFGAQLFSWTTSAAVVAISLWGVLRAPRSR